jgi:putative ABC transport system permease protein
MGALPSSRDDLFNAINFNTYILLRPGVRFASLEAKFPAFLRRALEHQGWDMKAFEGSGNYLKMNGTALTDIHLRSDRTRELGVRKVLGSSRGDLIARFLSESLLLTLVATVLAIAAAWGLLPFFNRLSGKELTITSHTITQLWPLIIIIIGVVGILAGFYPAFFLSSFQPANVLKGAGGNGSWVGFKRGRLRSFLVVFQFSISIFLIIGTLVIYNQLRYIRNKSLRVFSLAPSQNSNPLIVSHFAGRQPFILPVIHKVTKI